MSKHKILDPRDSQRLSDMLHPLLVQAAQLRGRRPDFAFHMATNPAAASASFDDCLVRYRQVLVDLEAVRSQALAIHEAFVPQYPLVPLAQS